MLLTIINSKAFLLKKHIENKDLSNAELIGYIETIEKTVKRIVKIIKGLKYFSRDGNSDPFEMVLLKDIIEETISFASTRFKSSDVSLVIDNYNELLNIQCRPIQISQVILNLVNNAIDALDNFESIQKKKVIKVEVLLKSGIVSINIIDNGPGVPDEHQRNIFKPFYTTKMLNKGTGLGLSISLGLVELHHGKLSYKRIDDLTYFVVEIPSIDAQYVD